ncbi:PREDICTED: G-protein-signaling modulator 2-like [Amphimedon queenslandica]|uniref:Uncharacterized protein n=1 Tax=Amphimedon queenslandica TaxID=400682 RepID=A0A1X7U4I5_AMPQE|nr:PREDICTED: G-protein-signaling modulator 2-like [Amphimedon queenslandica]|eukprot:XP_003389018.1 PREDICTED: G-protein-signaling modulator 2-like [Amphimedon queenslandica]
MALLVDNHYHRLINSEPVLEACPERDGIDEELEGLIIQSQSRRLNDQRTPLPPDPQQRLFLDLLLRLQGSRMDDQRASLHLDVKETELTSQPLPAQPAQTKEDLEDIRKPLSEEEFIDLLFRSQSSRINDQRSPDPQTYRQNLMPGEDFFNMLQHLQSTRIEDQRSPFPR